MTDPPGLNLPQILHAHVTANEANSVLLQKRRTTKMIGEVLEITIVVSMLVLVGYPSTLMALEALRVRRRCQVQVVRPRRCHRPPQSPGVGANGPLKAREPEKGKLLLTLTNR
jgi:hypothetical protein